MNEAAILETMREVVRDRLKVATPFDMSSDLRRDLQLDSLKALELVVAIENSFGICLGPEDEAELVTVGDVVRLIARETSK